MILLQQLKRFFGRKPLRFWLLLAGILIALLCFEEVVDDVFHDPKEGDFEAAVLDRSVGDFASAYRTERLTQVMTDLTSLGSVSVIATLSVVFLSVLVSFRDFRGVAYLSTLLIGAGLWPFLLKLYFSRPRPDEGTWLVNVSDLSFPSGHSFGAAAVYIGCAYYAGQKATHWQQEIFFYLLGALLALLVGLSRIYLGVHYSTDVLAGLSGGVAWGLLVPLGYEMLTGGRAVSR